MSATLRQKLGCWVHERWVAEVVLTAPKLARILGFDWQDLCNRQESLTRDSRTGGRVCPWPESRTLTVARVFPEVGGRLLRRCLDDWPIRFRSEVRARGSDRPDISVVLGVRGTARLQQFKACIDSIRAQAGTSPEIVVVEQSPEAEFAVVCPSDIHFVHQKCPPSMPYNRAWALNAGVHAARGRVVVVHDADMLIPERLAISTLTMLESGLEALRLPRFLFYLNEATSVRVQETRNFDQARRADRVIVNNRTPVAVLKSAYDAIGGHDVRFSGWGGEDDEFMDRLRTRALGEGPIFPIVHLWHAEAPRAQASSNIELLQSLRAISPKQRIKNLRDPCAGANSREALSRVDGVMGSSARLEIDEP